MLESRKKGNQWTKYQGMKNWMLRRHIKRNPITGWREDTVMATSSILLPMGHVPGTVEDCVSASYCRFGHGTIRHPNILITNFATTTMNPRFLRLERTMKGSDFDIEQLTIACLLTIHKIWSISYHIELQPIRQCTYWYCWCRFFVSRRLVILPCLLSTHPRQNEQNNHIICDIK